MLFFYCLKILIFLNLLSHYIKLNEDKENSKQKIDDDNCGFEKEKYTVACHLKCFRCGLEMTLSE